MKWIRSWPLLMAATALLTASAIWSVAEQFDLLGASLLSAGLVTLGAWIVEEVSGDD